MKQNKSTKTSFDVIFDVCKEEKIKYQLLSKDWVIKLNKNDKTKYVLGYKFDNNSHALGKIFDDKYAMYCLLKSFDLPVIEHNIIYKEDNENEYANGCKGYKYLNKLFKKYKSNVVIKVNNGSCGIGVFHSDNYDDLKQEYDRLISSRLSLSVCPFYDIKNEYRAIFVDNKLKLLYKKIKPVVVGDGKSTIKELLCKFNNNFFKDYNEENRDIVLKNGEKFEFGWKFNLSKGSISSMEIEDSDKIKIEEILNKINEKIELNFCSVDIVKTTQNKFLIMEINSGVMMNNFINQHSNGYAIAKDIYKCAILNMFK